MHEKWSKEKLHALAKQFDSTTAFQKKGKGAWEAAKRLGIRQELEAYWPRKIARPWTRARARAEAGKYKTRTAFARGSPGAYQFALRAGIIETACSHMPQPQHVWTKEELQTEALSCETRAQFQKERHGAYKAAIKRRILDEICTHMRDAYTGFNPRQSGMLYYLRVDAGNRRLWKIGVTNMTVDYRFTSKEMRKITVLHEERFLVGQHAYDKEQATLQQFAEHRYKGPNILESGNTELFVTDVLDLDSAA